MEFKLNDYHKNVSDDELLEDIKKVANKLKASLNPIGLNMINNNEKPLQSVDHFHIHLIPRYENDNFDILFKDNSKKVNLDEILKKING